MSEYSTLPHDRLGVPNYQRVRDAMRSDIARGVLAAETRLKIADLAARYGLSPAPIREALGQLAAEGWVVLHPNRGAWVRAIDEAFLRDLNDIRVALESYTVGLAAAVATPAQVDALERIEDAYEACLSGVEGASATAALIRLNAALHEAIHDIRPNHEALALMRRYGVFFNTMRGAWGYGDYRPKQIAAEHRSLLAAFRRNDGALAEQISREHIGNAMADLIQLWRNGGRR
ncbi:MAG: GntR family transcriptional regulator [Rhodospirillales bacterium]|nr:GntR family transcriptional regulator [Rhodospirillales bacterium]